MMIVVLVADGISWLLKVVLCIRHFPLLSFPCPHASSGILWTLKASAHVSSTMDKKKHIYFLGCVSFLEALWRHTYP